MSKLPAILKGAFLGLVCGFALALILGQWVWLEMRVTTGYAIPLGVILGGVWGALTGRGASCRTMLLGELVLALLFVALYGLDFGALSVVPACLLREGCRLDAFPLPWFNAVLGVAFLAGNLVWIAANVRRGTCPLPAAGTTPSRRA